MIRTAIPGAVALVVAAWFAFGALAHADTRVPVKVRIEPWAHGVTAKYRLSQPVARFRFEYTDGVKLRESTWRVTTPNLSLEGSEIKSADGALFTEFDVVVTARNELTESIYACVMKLGEQGRVIYASYFAGDQLAFDTTMAFVPAKGDAVLGLPRGGTTLHADRTARENQQAAAYYVYIGPRKFVTQTKVATFVVGPESPPWAQHEIEALAAPTLAFYRRQTDAAFARPPLIMTTTELGESSGAAIADVTEGPNVTFRFLGGVWTERSEKATPRLRSMVMHEYAHFWNSHLIRSRDNDTARWLHEGGAEYWARLAEANLKQTEGPLVSTNSELALNVCIEKLGGTPLSEIRSPAIYPCGEIVQWIADLGMRAKGQDIFDLWRELFASAGANGGYYSAALFREIASRDTPAVAEAFAIVIDQRGTERWSELPKALAQLGVTLEASPPTAEATREAAVMHILNGPCSGSFGFWAEESWLKLDTGDRCGPLSGDPEIDAINGHNMYDDTEAAVAAVREACRSNANVTFSRTNDARSWTILCDRALPVVPSTFKITTGR